ncbi:hypothetical protein [Ottowia oryzae]
MAVPAILADLADATVPTRVTAAAPMHAENGFRASVASAGSYQNHCKKAAARRAAWISC